MDGSYLALFGSITIVGILVFISIILTSKKRYTFDKTEYQTDFLTIENALEKSNRATYNLTIVEADKLLDKALIEMGLAGKTMGERLKRCGKEQLSHLDSVWRVHKIRNQIAHEPRFSVEYADARRALNTYRQALQDLGAL